MAKVLLIFLDGVGIGEADPEKNPFWKYNFKFIRSNFKKLPSLTNQVEIGETIAYFPLDAVMGIDGLPQSGTGQTSILCGVNASEVIGKHFGPFPYSTHIPILEKDNIFRMADDMGKKSFFVNAFPKMFYDYIKSGRRRIGAFALSVLLTGKKMNKAADLWRGKSLSNDITNKRWRTRIGYKVKEISSEKAAERLLNISEENDLTVYEYFLTDHIGHGRIKEERESILQDLDNFLFHLLQNKSEELEVIITSDHGNFEDISIKSHTSNPVLTIYSGKYLLSFYNKVKDLSDIKWAIKQILEY